MGTRSRGGEKRALLAFTIDRFQVNPTPYANFSEYPKWAGKYYREGFRVAPLAYVSFPNAAFPTAYELSNTLSYAEVREIAMAFVEEDPRTEPPNQDHPRSDFPARLRTKWNAAKAEEREFALATKKKAGDGDEAPHPQPAAPRVINWRIWDNGPLYTARLNTGAQVIFIQRPPEIIVHGVNQEGLQIPRQTQVWKRFHLPHAAFRNTRQNAPGIAALAACDTAISDISPPPIERVFGPGLFSALVPALPLAFSSLRASTNFVGPAKTRSHLRAQYIPWRIVSGGMRPNRIGSK